jgi:hypothetical protein
MSDGEDLCGAWATIGLRWVMDGQVVATGEFDPMMLPRYGLGFSGSGRGLGGHVFCSERTLLTMSFTTPTYLAQKTFTSTSFEEARNRAISLYRQWQRAVDCVV